MQLTLFSLVLPILIQSTTGHLIIPFDADADSLSPNNAASAISGVSNRPLFPNFDDILSDESLLALPTSYTYSLPVAGCPSTYEKTEGECPTQRTRIGETSGLRSVNVTYNDCGSSFQLCHCASADLTLDESVKLLGRVPVGLRRYAGLIAVMPVEGGSGEHAYTLSNTGEIHIFGKAHVRTWLHEIAHAFDFATKTAYSLSDAFQDAVSSDECVPDDYAQSSFPENFAQMSVLATWLLMRPSLPTQSKGLEIDTACMSNAMSFMMALPTFNPTTLFGETCAIETTGQDSRGARKTGQTAQDLIAEKDSPAIAPVVVTARETTTEDLGELGLDYDTAALDPTVGPALDPSGAVAPALDPSGGAERLLSSPSTAILLPAALLLLSLA